MANMTDHIADCNTVEQETTSIKEVIDRICEHILWSDLSYSAVDPLTVKTKAGTWYIPLPEPAAKLMFHFTAENGLLFVGVMLGDSVRYGKYIKVHPITGGGCAYETTLRILPTVADVPVIPGASAELDAYERKVADASDYTLSGLRTISLSQFGEISPELTLNFPLTFVGVNGTEFNAKLVGKNHSLHFSYRLSRYSDIKTYVWKPSHPKRINTVIMAAMAMMSYTALMEIGKSQPKFAAALDTLWMTELRNPIRVHRIVTSLIVNELPPAEKSIVRLQMRDFAINPTETTTKLDRPVMVKPTVGLQVKPGLTVPPETTPIIPAYAKMLPTVSGPFTESTIMACCKRVFDKSGQTELPISEFKDGLFAVLSDMSAVLGLDMPVIRMSLLMTDNNWSVEREVTKGVWEIVPILPPFKLL